MTPAEPNQPPEERRPDGPGLVPPAPTLAQEPGEEQGRIGYGRHSRLTPIGIALLIVIALIAIAVAGRDREAKPADRLLAGTPAPGLAFTTFDGQTLSFEELRGHVVVVNFWASWCEPCRREAALFEAVYRSTAGTAVPVTVVGVDIKNDSEPAARDFARQHGITYPLVRDGQGGNATRGLIELAFGINPFYPTTLFIAPDGTLSALHVGELSEQQLAAYVAQATG